MKVLKVLFIIWNWTSRIAYVITKIDEAIEQWKVFYDWLKNGDEDDPENAKKTP